LLASVLNLTEYSFPKELELLATSVESAAVQA